MGSDTRVQHALDDLLAGKACVDDSRTALADYLESGPRLGGLTPQAVESARRNYSRALDSLNRAEKMLRFLLSHMGDAA